MEGGEENKTLQEKGKGQPVRSYLFFEFNRHGTLQFADGSEVKRFDHHSDGGKRGEAHQNQTFGKRQKKQTKDRKQNE